MSTTSVSNEPISAYEPKEVMVLDPYEDIVAQHWALESLGYPARMQKVNIQPEQLVDDYEWWKFYDRFPGAGIRVVEQDFERFVPHPDAPGDVCWSHNLHEKDVDRIQCHPIGQLLEVSGGGTHMLEYYASQKEMKLQLYRPENGLGIEISDGELILRLAATAMWRNKLASERGYDLQQGSVLSPGVNIERLAVEQDARPLNAEQVVGLFVNFYQLVEAVIPEIVEFKRA